MKQIIALLALTTLAACASKTTSSTPAKQDAPPAATSPEKPAEAKKEDKSAKKSKKAKTETAQSAAGEKAATDKKASTVGTAEVNCKSGTDERKLSIQVKGSGCELNYTKNGETKAIASQINGSEKCEEVMTSVKNKLVAAGHTCN